jgi:hypothetical protein
LTFVITKRRIPPLRGGDMANGLSRREALKVGSSLLVAGVPSASAVLAFTQGYSRDALTRRAEEIVNFTTSQEFMAELDAVLNSPKEKQLDEAARRFDPKRLNARGLIPPKNTRISSRIFDETLCKSTILGESGPVTTLNVSTSGRKPTKGDIDELVDRNKLIEQVGKTNAGVCVCVGGGACVGVGG